MWRVRGCNGDAVCASKVKGKLWALGKKDTGDFLAQNKDDVKKSPFGRITYIREE
jgi:hypothetical protein